VSRGRARLARSPRLARAPATAAARTTIEFLERRSLRQVQQELAVRASVCVLIFVLNEWVHAGVGVEPDPTIRAAALTGVLYIAGHRPMQERPFFGADVASLLPKVRPSAVSLVTLVIVTGTSWIMGYTWAFLYNRLAKIV
jgi:hypothetical protein